MLIRNLLVCGENLGKEESAGLREEGMVTEEGMIILYSE
jgi:hypothetical protein